MSYNIDDLQKINTNNVWFNVKVNKMFSNICLPPSQHTHIYLYSVSEKWLARSKHVIKSVIKIFVIRRLNGT